MRRRLFFMLALPLVLAACGKSDKCPYTTSTAVAGTAEIADLKTFLDTNSLAYTQHPSGIFYKTIIRGSGTVPGPCSNVTVKYIGRLTNGTAFDSSYKREPDGLTFTLGELIAGWQIGIPLIQKGGSITLYIPPSLGYGQQDLRDNYGNISVPANSTLIFNIELVNVQ